LCVLFTAAVAVGVSASEPAWATALTSPCCSVGLSQDGDVTGAIPSGTPTTADCHSLCTPSSLGGGVFQVVCQPADYFSPTDPTSLSVKAVAVHDTGTGLCRDTSNHQTDYCSFGWVYNSETTIGTTYYCAWAQVDGGGNYLGEVDLNGSQGDDILQLWWDASGTETFMDTNGAYDSNIGGVFSGRIHAFGGNDVEEGSDSTHNSTCSFPPISPGGVPRDTTGGRRETVPWTVSHSRALVRP